MPYPVAFLCHASEDKDLARRIAISLVQNGIPTFFDEWEIRAGDSIRQKIDRGLSDCTHFIVLLTVHSIVKPWVNAEIDAAFMQKMEGRSKVIPLRFNLPHTAVPPLLKALNAPEITEALYNEQITSLVADIFGISSRPPLGPTPELLASDLVQRTGLSQAALLVARYFVVNSEYGHGDPQLTIGALRDKLNLGRDDAVDGIDELARIGTIHVHRSFGPDENHHLSPKPRLFALFDRYWRDWNPKDDALLIAARLLANQGSGMQTKDIAKEFGWPVRRLNPALSMLIDQGAVRVGKTLSHPEIKDWVQATDETRRYVKQRS